MLLLFGAEKVYVAPVVLYRYKCIYIIINGLSMSERNFPESQGRCCVYGRVNFRGRVRVKITRDTRNLTALSVFRQ